MKFTTKKLYLVMYDNCGQYEDHYTSPLCIVNVESKAKKVVEECNNWIARINEEKPKWDHDAENESDLDYFERVRKFKKYFTDLTPMFSELKEDIEYNNGGRVYFVEIPVAK